MQEQLISFETAKLAKEKGFIECVTNYYHIHEGLTEPILIDEIDILLKNYKRPYEVRKNWNTVSAEFGYVENFSATTQSFLQKWLREVHKIDVIATPVRWTGDIDIAYWTYAIQGVQPVGKEHYKFNNYEEALEIGLQKALKLIEIIKEK